MGLYVSHMETVSIKSDGAEDRSLYIYLLDYGWPNGEWEQLFKRHFWSMAERASQTRAIVIGSNNGVHFGNEVLSWHRVGDLDANEVLPGLLITKTPPHYFRESYDERLPAEPGLEDVLVVPLKPFCKDETDFLRAIDSVFSDLKNGVELKNFQIAKHKHDNEPVKEVGRRFMKALEVKPGAFGVAIDLKALFTPSK